jgi:tetratricopeptide (TPR) repeat protein
LALGLGLLGTAHVSWAQADGPSLADKETARQLFRDGDEKFRAGDYESALKAFAAADDIMRVPTTGLERARTLDRLSLLLEAAEHLQRIIRIPQAPEENVVQQQARDEARAMLEEVRARIPSLEVLVAGAGDAEVKMLVDDVEVPPSAQGFPRKVDPGMHRVQVVAAGFKPAEKSIEVTEGRQEKLTLTLESAGGGASVVDPWSNGQPDDADGGGNGYAIMMWTGFGVGAAGVIVGSITGAMSLAKRSDLEDKCGGAECPADLLKERDDALPIAHVSTAGFVIGGVGLALGTVGLVLNVRSDDSTVAVAPWIGPTSAGVRGSF